MLGSVNVDNRGVTGIEKYIDDKVGVDPVHAAVLSSRAPVRLSLDIGVQHALEDELDAADKRYQDARAPPVSFSTSRRAKFWRARRCRESIRRGRRKLSTTSTSIG